LIWYKACTVVPPPAATVEEAWLAASQANAVAGYQTYLDAFPKGRYAAAARSRMAALKEAAVQLF
jgi:hypothetical protein